MRKPNRFKPNPLLALLTATATGSLIANPQAPLVVNGQATFSQAGNTLTVTNTPGTIINWQQFNINRGELTRFVQQSASSQVLNRVTGVDPSVILGSLQSNGRVFLVNPNGIVFGAGSQVDVAGLVASTLRLSDSDFTNNRLRFTDTPGAGGVSNAGTIKSAVGGEILLVAPRVENSGLIQAPDGKILLAAGRSVEVADIDRPNIRVEISNTDEYAVNLGTLLARNISIYGGLVRNSGHLQASSAVMGENGKVTLRAAQRVVLEPSSVIEASGSQGTTGGEISITAQNTLGLANGGEVLVQGVVSAQPVMDVRGAVYVPNRPVAPAGYAQTATNLIANSMVSGDSGAPAVQPVGAVQELAVPGGVGGQTGSEPAALPPNSAALIGAASLSSPLPAPLPVPSPEPSRPAPFTPALPVSPGAPISPSGGYGMGGSVRISAGGRVIVGDGARIDTSGTYGGGEILVGGGWQGLNPNLINSQFTYIASSATLYSNAYLRGNGGLVVVWANDTSRVYGSIAARGGALGGDGGAIETSGKQFLDVTQAADASAAHGKAGQWLLDPNNVTIQSTGADTGVTGNPNFTTTADSSIITVATIQAALNNGTSVTITTSAGGAQLGDIVLSGAIVSTSSSDVTLTLNAHNNINLNANISATGAGKLNLVLNANTDLTGGGVATMGGSTTLALKGGTLGSSNGSVLNASTGTLDSVVLATGVNVTSGILKIAGSLDFGSGNTITMSGASTELQYTSSQTWSGTGNIVFANTNNYIWGNASGVTLTIGSGITLSSTGAGYAYLGYYTPDAIVLQGQLDANNASKTWQVSPGTFTLGSSGRINLSAGTLNLGGTWTNSATAGNFAVTSGTLNLSGSMTGAGLGTISRTGGTVTMTGTISNTGNTIDVGSSGTFGVGGLSAWSGTISGGTIMSGDGTALNSSSLTLNGVTLGSAAKPNLTVNGSVFVSGSLTLADGAVINKGAGYWYFNTTGNQSISTATTATINSAGGAMYAGYSVAGQTLTIGNGVTLQGYGQLVDSSVAPIVNNGTIIANTAGQTFTINPTTFTNHGALSLTGGTLTISATNWSNTGNFSVSSGVLNINGNVLAGGLGSFTRTGGTVNLGGTFDNTGNTLDIGGTGIFGPGGLTSVAGTFIGGTIVSGDGVALTSSSATFSGVTLGSAAKPNLTVNGSVFMSSSLTLGDGAVINKGANYWYFNATGNQSISTTTTATISSAGGAIYVGYGVTGQTLTLGSGVTLQGYGQLLDSSVATIVNNGTIIANTAGQTFTINPTTFTNNGLLSLTGGTLSVAAGNWSNTGSFNVSSGVLNINGSVLAGGLGSFNRTGGTVNLGGTFNNTGNTLDIGGAGIFGPGGLTSVAGTFIGGTIVSGDGVALTSNNATFNGVTLGSAAKPNLTVNGAMYVAGSLTLGDGAVVNKGANYWYFNTIGNQSISTATTATINSSGGVIYAGYGVTGQTLTLGSGVTLQGYGQMSDSSAATMVNNGAIIANTAGQTFTINPTNFTNNGTLRVTAGTLNVSPTNWTNSATGLIEALGGTLNLSGTNLANAGAISIAAATTFNIGGALTLSSLSNFNRAAGSTVNLTGTLDLAGSSLEIGSAGIFGVGGLNSLTGTIKNGTINSAAGNTLVSAGTGTLDNVTIGTNLTFSNNSFNILNGLKLTNGITVNKGSSYFYFYGNQSIAPVNAGDTATLIQSGGILYVASGGTGQTLTLGAGITLQGSGSINNYYGGNFVNNGAVNFTANSGLSLDGFTNNGTVTVSAGTTTFGGTTVNNNGALTISGSAAVNANPTNWNNNTGGTVDIQSGSFSFSGTTLVNNSGGLSLAAGAVLSLGGNYTLTNLTGYLGGAQFNRAAGSTVNLTGTLDLAGSSLEIGSAGIFGVGGLNSLTGTIKNGTINSAAGNTLVSAGTGTLDNVTIGTNLTFSNNSFNILNGLKLTNGITVNKGSSYFYFYGNQSIAPVNAGDTATLIQSGGILYVASGGTGQTLTLGAGITLQGSGSINNYYGGNFVNNGAVNFTANSGLSLDGFTNNGTVTVSAGTTTFGGTTVNNNGALTISGSAAVNANPTNWNNNTGGTVDIQSGSFSFSGTTLVNNSGGLSLAAGAVLSLGGNYTLTNLTGYLGGAQFNRAAGSTVNLTGTLDLAGSSLEIGSAGIFGVGGLNSLTGTIKNGTINSAAGNTLVSAGTGTLDNVTIGTNLTFSNNSFNILNGLKLTNGITVNKGSSYFYFYGNQSIAPVNAGDTATLIQSGGILYVASGGTGQTLTLGAGITLQGSGSINNYYGGNFVNNGAVNFTANSGLSLDGFTNNGTVTVSAGTTSLSAITATNNGMVRIAAGGLLSLGGTTTFNSPGTGIDLQSGGTFNVAGTYAIAGGIPIVAGAVVNLQAGITTAQFANLNFQGGTAILNSTLTNSGTLTLAGTSGKLQLGSSGVISGGTVATSGGVTLSATGGTLTGVTLATDMTVENGGSLQILNGLTLSGGKRLIIDSAGSNTYLYVNGTGSQTITGTGSIEFSGIGVNTRHVSYSSGTPSLVIDTGITVNANAGGDFWNVAAALTVNGSFNVNTADMVTMGVSSFNRGGSSAFGVLAGTLRLNGATNDYSGSWNVASGATLDLNHSVARTLGSGFIVTGTGRIANENSTLTINGMPNTTAGFAQLGSGTTTFNTAINMGSLEIAAGTVNGAVALNVAGSFNMTGGTLSNTGSTSVGGLASNWTNGTINAGTFNNSGVMQIGGSGYSTLTGATTVMNNTGTLIYNKSGLNWRVEAGATLNNLASGAIDLQTAVSLVSLSGTGYLNNDGTIRKTTATSATISNIVVDNRAAAKIDVQAGTLSIGTLLAATNNGVLNIESGATFTYAGALTNAGTLSGAGTLNMGGSTLTNNGTIAPGTATDATGTLTIVGSLTLGAAGTVQAQLDDTALGNYDTLVVSANINYGGTLALSGTAVAGNFNVVTSATRTLNSIFSTVGGNIAGAVPVYSGTGLTIGISAAGQWTGLGDGFTWGNALNWGGGVLPGAADDVVIASAGSTLVVSSGAFGVKSLTLGSGRSLQVSGGALTLGSASVLGGGLTVSSGALTINGTTTLAGTFTQSGGALQGSGSLALNAGGTWSGGTIDGGISVTNAVGQAFNIVGTGTLGFGAATFNNNGTLTWSGSHIEILGNGTINNNNAALLDITADFDFGDRWTGVGTLTLNNQAGATLRKSAGTGISSFGSSGGATPNGVNFNNAGSVQVQTGTLSINEAWVASPLPTGTGTSSGSFTVASGATLKLGGTNTLTAAATLSGAGNVVLQHGAFTSSANWLNAMGLTVNGGTARFINSVALGSINLAGGALQLDGASNTVGGLVASAGTTFAVNGATQSTGTLSMGSATLNGSSVLTLSAASNFSAAVLNADVNIGNGVGLVVSNGLTFQNGHSIFLSPTTGTTTLELSGPQTIGGTGRIVFNGTDGNHRIYTNVSNDVTGIVLGAGVTLDVNQTGRIDGAGASNQVLTNNGVINVAAGKTLNLETIAVINNAGTINSNGTLVIDPSYLGGGNCCTFNNTGQVHILAGTASILGNGTDTGVYTVASAATLNFNGGGVRTWGGTYSLAGGTMAFNNQSVVLTGSIDGLGTLDFGTGTLTNNGAISPGVAQGLTTGTLNIVGNLVMGTGVLNMDLNTDTAGNYDVVAVTGNVAFGGTLSLSGSATTGIFNVVTSASSSSAFATVSGLSGVSPVYSGTGLTLNIAIVMGQWLGSVNNDWGNPLNWSGATLPGVNDDVVISNAGATISLNAGNFTVKSISTVAGRGLQLNGGGLTVTDTSYLDGALTIAGGTLTLNGSTALTGAVAISSGALNGVGPIVTSGITTLSGGTLGITSWVNNGTINKTGGSTVTLGSATPTYFDNSGTINVQAGELNFGTATGSDIGATYNVSSGATLRFNADRAFYSSDQAIPVPTTFNGTGAVVFDGGTQTFGNGQTFVVGGPSVSVLSGTLMSSSDLEFQDSFTWSGGTIAGAGQLITSGTSTVSGGSLDTKVWNNTGNLLKVGGGVFDVANGTTSTFNNTGTVSVNAGEFKVGTATGVDTGTYAIASGAMLRFASDHSFASTSSFNGAGSVVVDGGTQVFASGVQINAATTLNAGLVTLDDVALSRTLTYAGGTLLLGAGKTLSIGSGGALNVAPGLSLVLTSGTVSMNGGALTGGTGSTLNLAGVGLNVLGGANTVSGLALTAGSVTVAAAAELLLSSGSMDVAALTNDGVVHSASTTGAINVLGSGTHTGQFVADAGAGIKFGSGVQTFNGATFAGAGAITNTGANGMVVGVNGLTVAAGTSADLNNLALTGTGTLTNDGTLTGNAYTLPIALTNSATGTLNLTNGGVSGDFNNLGTFNVGGTVLLSGAVADQQGGQIVIPVGATLERNNGALQWINGTVGGNGGGAGSVVTSGAGSFVFAGTGDRVIDGLNFTFNNLTLPNGSLTVQSGSLTLTGAAVLPAGVTLNLNGGTLTNSGTLDIGGTFDLSGGAFAGGGSLNMVGGALNLPATNTVVWTNNGAITNTGTLNLAGSTIANAITNNGVINVGSGLTFNQAFVNNNTLVLGTGSGTTNFAGGLVQNGSASTSTQLNGGTLLGSLTVNGGKLSGSGTVDGSVTVLSGSLAPGFSPGAITVTGNLNLNSTSVLTVELGGLTQGSATNGYDYVNVLGTANLAGTLNVTSFNGFVAPASSSYTFMNFASTTGSFASVNLPAGWNLAYLPATTNLSLLAPAAASALTAVALAALPIAPSLTPESVALTLQRADTSAAPLEVFSAPEQKLVSVEKPIAEEACQ